MPHVILMSDKGDNTNTYKLRGRENGRCVELVHLTAVKDVSRSWGGLHSKPSCVKSFSHSGREQIGGESREIARGGGGTPLYGLYRYVRPQRVWFFSRFGHK